MNADEIRATATVKWRDVPFEELCQGYRSFGKKEMWEPYRGKVVRIYISEIVPVEKVPPRSPHASFALLCGGPFWKVVGAEEKLGACIHMLEMD